MKAPRPSSGLVCLESNNICLTKQSRTLLHSIYRGNVYKTLHICTDQVKLKFTLYLFLSICVPKTEINYLLLMKKMVIFGKSTYIERTDASKSQQPLSCYDNH